ncbi:DUF305 domain-containing protein [Streptomyces iconiensis]|uniref:DUF305 domain-containing protein n=1 Tax=Streptomyces iconiensis TaxID=1384038 RepID=A0ABT7A8X3_9ACTN|nr:DUF305 domain-containing protein [Streptomyces iconiensis]MDJ1137261.1 DUF305 domain-containing protein [Streptomyces iconiensis]
MGLPALTACESGAEEKRADRGQGVVAPGKPGEEAETLSPEKAREKAGGDTKANAADFRYATMMIAHHQQAVVMTDLAPQRAGSDSVRKLASRIGASQGPEIKAMRGWLKQNRSAKNAPEDGGKSGGHGDHGSGHGDHGGKGDGSGEHGDHGAGGGDGGHAGMPGMATEAQLAKLRAAKGTAFDLLFLTLMTTHHEGAITMAVELMKGGNDVRVEEMATDVMAQQRAEIKRMRKLG